MPSQDLSEEIQAFNQYDMEHLTTWHLLNDTNHKSESCSVQGCMKIMKHLSPETWNMKDHFQLKDSVHQQQSGKIRTAAHFKDALPGTPSDPILESNFTN